MSTLIPQDPSQADPSIVALMHGIKMQEGGGTINYNAIGDRGTAAGAGQWSNQPNGKPVPLTQGQIPSNFVNAAQHYGLDPTDFSPDNQNKVLYAEIASGKQSGLTPEQILSAHNSGRPNAYLIPSQAVGTGSVGAYNVAQYVKQAMNYAQTFAQSQQPQGGSLIPTAEASTGQMQPQDQGMSVGGLISNAASDTGSVLGALGNAIMHPIKTLSNLGSIIGGAVEKPFGVQNQDTQNFDSLVHSYAQKYGGNSISDVIHNIGNTLYTHPVSTLLDLSTVLDGAGAAVGAVGKIADISKVAELSKAADYISSIDGLIKTGTPEATALLKQEGTLTQIGNALTTIGKYTNPLGAFAGVGSKAIGLGGKVAGEALGVSTGAGFGAIKGAFDAGTEGGLAQSAFRAGISGGEEGANTLIDAAQQAFRDHTVQKSLDYQGTLDEIKQGTHTLSEQAFKPIADTFDNLLNKFDITKNPDGGLNFSNSRIRNEAVSVGDIQDINTEIQKYVDGGKQITPVNIDDLKQFIDARYSAGSRGSSFTTQLNNVVKKTLRDNVPKYEDLTKNYNLASNAERDFKQSLSIGGKASRETILKKLTSTLRANNEYRQALLKDLSQGANKDIFSQAAGTSMQSVIPIGLSKYATELAAFMNPHVLLALPFQSPRIVGEFVNALGKGNRVLESIGNAFIKYKGPLITKGGVIANQTVGKPTQ